MGMFDYIKCEYSLNRFNIPDIQNLEYQTKGLDNSLNNYTITERGELIFHKYEYVHVPEEERPYYGKSEWDKSALFRLCGSFKRLPIGDELLDFTGILNFYSDLPNGGWLEFETKFKDGILQKIECVIYKKGELPS